MTDEVFDHPSAERLQAFSLGLSDDAELAVIGAHVAGCDDCCARLGELRPVDEWVVHLSEAARQADANLEEAAERQSAVRAILQQTPLPTRTSMGPSASPITRLLPLPETVPEVIGAYRVAGIVGRGGMGIVYKARDERLNRFVAVKMILAGEYAAPEQLMRFRLEAELAARVQHPDVVRVYEVGEHQGRPFLAMEWVDGGTLAESLRGTPLPVREAAQLVERIARAVYAAHCQGVVHRDLKPGNILLAESGPKVADFGLARPSERSSALTASGVMLGTPEYVAPEQLVSHHQDVGPAADIYAMGVILYELLAGRPPFLGATAFETLKRVQESQPDRLRQVRRDCPPDLETICLKCLSKDSSRRYTTAAIFADDLRCFLNRQPILARPVGSVERAFKWVRRNPVLALLLVSVVAAVLAGSTISIYFGILAGKRATDAETARGRAESLAFQETKLRHTADLQLYAARMAMAQNAWAESDIRRALELLDLCVPIGEQEDFRGWEWHYVYRLCHSELMRLGGHDGPVFAVAYSPDGRLIASAGGGNLYYLSQGGIGPGQVIVRDAAAGSVIYRFTDFKHMVTAIAFSPDNHLLAVGCHDGTVSVRDLKSGQEIIQLESAGGSITTVAFGPDGTQLMAVAGYIRQGTGNTSITFWEVKTGRRISRYGGGTEHIRAAALDPDGRRYVYTVDREIRCADSRTGEVIWKNQDAQGQLRTIAFSPDGRLLATGGEDGRVKLFDANTGLNQKLLGTHVGEVRSASFSSEGRFLATSGDKPEVKLWDVARGELVRTVRGPTNIVETVAFSPDGSRIATGDHDGTVKVWDVEHDQRGILRGDIGFYSARSEMRFEPGGNRLMETLGSRWRLDTIDTRTGSVTPRLFHSNVKDKVGAQCAVSPDASWMAGIDQKKPNILLFWDLAGEVEKQAQVDQFGQVSALQFGPKNAWFVASHLYREGGSYAYKVVVWNAAEGRPMQVLEDNSPRSHAGEPRLGHGACVAISPDGKLIAHAGYFGKVRIWERNTGKVIGELGESDSWCRSLTFSGDGRLLAGQFVQGHLRVWNVADWSERCRMAHAITECGLALSADGRRLASADTAGTIRLWETESGQPVFELRSLTTRGTAGIRAQAAFDDTGMRLASFNNNDTTNLFDATLIPTLVDPLKSSP